MINRMNLIVGIMLFGVNREKYEIEVTGVTELNGVPV